MFHELLRAQAGQQVQASTPQTVGAVHFTHTVLAVHERGEKRETNVIHARIHHASVGRVTVAEVNKLYLGVALDNPLHYLIGISGDEGVVLSKNAPVSVAFQKITPHIQVTEHASLLGCRRITVPAFTERLGIKV